MVATGACGSSKRSDAQVLRSLLAATAAAPRAFVYEETTPTSTLAVRGRVEDDLRYKATVSVAGIPAFEEVVADDALADRVVAGSSDAFLLRSPASTSPPVPPALAEGRWVVDRYGAPSLLTSARERHPVGEDPIYDALTVLRYVDGAMTQSLGARKFNPDSLDYHPNEDPFPAPKRGSGIVRYDLPPPRLPRSSDVSTSGASRQTIPDTPNFRKLSVYVKGGRVIQILEQIDLRPRLRDLDRDYALKIPPGTPEERASVALERLNAVRRAAGGQPIRVRELTVSFVDVGRGEPISLPEDAVEGDLSLFVHRGTAAASAASATTTTTTTVVSGA